MCLSIYHLLVTCKTRSWNQNRIRKTIRTSQCTSFHLIVVVYLGGPLFTYRRAPLCLIKQVSVITGFRPPTSLSRGMPVPRATRFSPSHLVAPGVVAVFCVRTKVLVFSSHVRPRGPEDQTPAQTGYASQRPTTLSRLQVIYLRLP